MRAPVPLTLLLALAGCAAARVPPVAAPGAPSTHRDPPAHLPAPSADPRTGTLVGIAASGGEDQARELLVALVDSICTGDLEALREILAAEVFHGGALRAGRLRSAMPGERFAGQLLAHARLVRVAPETRFADLVQPASVRVEAVEAALCRDRAPGGCERLPAELRPGDLLVRFAATAAGSRPLALLAPDGQGALVVRPGERPRVVAR
jgi:hypothetical protein